MAYLSTSLGGAFAGLVSGVGRLAGSLAPAAGAALQAYAGSRAMRSMQPVAMPGGAYPMVGGPGFSSPTLLGAGLGLGSSLLPGWLPGGGGSIDPQGGILGFGRQRLPRIVHVTNPNDANVIETYVKAPRVKYRVSIARSGARRRCAGGR